MGVPLAPVLEQEPNCSSNARGCLSKGPLVFVMYMYAYNIHVLYDMYGERERERDGVLFRLQYMVKVTASCLERCSPG